MERSPPPGAFPETPAPDDNQTFSVNPLPASGKDTVESGVHDDPELMAQDEARQQQQGEQTYGVAPIPAMGGAGNPIQLAPGEKVPDPSTLTNNTVESTVKTDQASYEKSDAGVPMNQPSEQFGATPSTALLGGRGPVIPESSMAMGDSKDISKENVGPFTSSVGPGSSTAAMAGQVPKEPRGIPEIVKESQQEAHVDPEASANPSAVDEKKEMENELQQKVSEAPSTSESGLLGRSEDGVGAKVAAGVAATGAAAAGAAFVANEFVKDKTNQDPKAALPESVQKTVDDKAQESSIPEKATTPATTDAAQGTTTAVPEEVKESQKEAGFEPEASANPTAVEEKAAVEDELLKKVPESEAQGKPAPTESAAAATTAPAPTSESAAPLAETTSSTGAPQLGDPTAGVAPISMDDKPADASALNASKDSPAQPMVGNASNESEPQTLVGKMKQQEDSAKAASSGDVSPLAKPSTEQQTAPHVTTGVGSSEAPVTSTPAAASSEAPAAVPRNNGPANSTPQKRQSFVDRLKGTPESSRTAGSTDSKKEKRKSFFGKLKEKLKS